MLVSASIADSTAALHARQELAPSALRLQLPLRPARRFFHGRAPRRLPRNLSHRVLGPQPAQLQDRARVSLRMISHSLCTSSTDALSSQTRLDREPTSRAGPASREPTFTLFLRPLARPAPHVRVASLCVISPHSLAGDRPSLSPTWRDLPARTVGAELGSRHCVFRPLGAVRARQCPARDHLAPDCARLDSHASSC